jgi:hypothetical protein
MPKTEPLKLNTSKKGTFKINNIPIDRIINFCSWRFFIVAGWKYKYRKNAVPINEGLPFTIID